MIFAHGSASSRRHSPRNQFVARVIRESGNGTLLFDLLSAEEEIGDNVTPSLRFNIGLLASRLAEVTRWLVVQPAAREVGEPTRYPSQAFAFDAVARLMGGSINLSANHQTRL